MTFPLGRTRFVYAIRLRFSYADTAADSVLFEMSWGARGHNEPGDAGASSKQRRFHLKLSVDPTREVLTLVDGKARYEPLRPDKVVTVWVNDTVDYFRIYPDTSPCVFKLSGIVLLMP